jgi:SAM-dependent methyltransferase
MPPPVVQAIAEHLPFADGSFDAAMAILTLQHLADVGAGIAEMARVARRRVVLVTFDPEHLDPRIRAATSTWHVVPPSAARRAIHHLRHDLATGKWDERYGYLRQLEALDVGLRLLRAELAPPV